MKIFLMLLCVWTFLHVLYMSLCICVFMLECVCAFYLRVSSSLCMSSCCPSACSHDSSVCVCVFEYISVCVWRGGGRSPVPRQNNEGKWIPDGLFFLFFSVLSMTWGEWQASNGNQTHTLWLWTGPTASCRRRAGPALRLGTAPLSSSQQ